MDRNSGAGLIGRRYAALTYGAAHAAVDSATILVVMSSRALHGLSVPEAFLIIVTYDALAFGLQAPLGLFLDRFGLAKPTGLAGISLAGLALLLLRIDPVAAMILAGIGNAAFHVGIGALSLDIQPGRATPPGIYVAPGSLGLAIGIFFSKSADITILPFLLALAISLALILIQQHPDIPRYGLGKPARLGIRAPHLVLIVLLFSISIRGFVGLAGAAGLPKTTLALFGAALAQLAGKSLGGILSDRLGWMRISIGSLLVSAPLLAFGRGDAWIMIAGMLLFQMTMPVTLVAAWTIHKNRPGLIFGLNCLALLAGFVPIALYGVRLQPFNPWICIGLILLSAGLVFLGLNALRDRVPMRFAASAVNPERR